MVKITKCPPGKALGAGDLHTWASRRLSGRSGVPGQQDAGALNDWSRNREPKWLKKWLKKFPKGVRNIIKKKVMKRQPRPKE
jgi:hypothetical protein